MYLWFRSTGGLWGWGGCNLPLFLSFSKEKKVQATVECNKKYETAFEKAKTYTNKLRGNTWNKFDQLKKGTIRVVY